MVSIKVLGAHLIIIALAGIGNTASEFVCPSEKGIFTNDDECHSYYICSSGKSNLRLCPSGLLFNSITKICDWPAYVSCTSKDRKMAPEPEYRLGIPSPEISCTELFRIPGTADCQEFYSCVGGVAYKERCSKGLFFNSKTQNCDFPQNVQCIAAQAAVPGDLCRNPGARFPNKQNCSTFWQQCADGNVLGTCDPGHHYSEKLKQCIEPCAARCDPKIVCDRVTTVVTTSMGPITITPSTVTTRTTTVPTTTTAVILEFSCPEANALFRNPKDCGSFWICSNKNPVLKHCPKGLHFSEQLKQCVEPCAAKCETSVDCKSQQNRTQCQESQFSRHERDCTKFYTCSNGAWLPLSCPVGLHFNELSSACDFPCNAKCDKNVDCFSDPDLCHPNGLYRHVSDCTKFYSCGSGVAYLMNCPAGLHFDSARKICNWPCEAECDQRINCLAEEENKTSSETLGNVCKGEEFYPDDGNCSQFYSCHKWKAYVQVCPSGLHWNKQKSLCDWPCNAKCDTSLNCEKKPEDEETKHPYITTSEVCKGREFYPHEKECTQFYHCAHGVAYLKDCPDNLHWSVTQNRCEWPCLAKCDPTLSCGNFGGLNDTVTNICNGNTDYLRGKDCTKFYHCTHGRAYLKDCPDGLHWSEERRRCDWPCEAKCDPKAICNPIIPVDPLYPPANRSDICKEKEFYPHEHDCGKFYHCANRVAYMKICPANLHWSVERNRCEWNCNAKCDATLKCNNIDGNWIEPTLPNITRNDKCESKEFYPHERDCTKFYHCTHGIAYLKVCPSVLHWSIERNRCEWPCIAGCDKNQKCETNFVPPEEPTLPVITKNDFCKGKEFYPHETDCTRFYHCDLGIAYLKVCPSSLHWSVARDRCEWPCIAQCQKQLNCDKSTIDPLEPTLPVIIKPGKCVDKEFYPHENDCTKFYHCANGIAFLKVCPADLHWSVKRNRCERPCIAECVKQQDCGNKIVDPSEPTLPVITRRDICKGNEFYPYENECNKFYHCDGDIAYLKVCPSNLDWSRQLNRCEWKCTAHCNPNLKCGDVTKDDPEEPTLPVITKDDICKEKEFYPHQSDCGKFYHCSHGRAYMKVCPSHLHWNIEKNVCDWPCSAQCIKQKKCDNDFVDPVEPTLPVIINKGMCKNKEFYPHEKDCTMFYHCDHGIAYLKVCPSNLHWSNPRNRCEWPCIAQCDARSKCEEKTGEITDPTLPVIKKSDVCKGAEFYPHETDCSKFYHCDHGIGYIKVCPSILHWSVERNRCEWPCIAKCEKNLKCEEKTLDPEEPTLPVITKRDLCKDKEFYPHENDCTKFYHCAHKIANMKLCPSNLHWSADRNRCEAPCIAKCEKTQQKCENVLIHPVEPNLPNIIRRDICHGKEFYLHPTDCTKFYHCAHGLGYLKVCPGFLHWSEQKNLCESPCVAKCNTTIKCGDIKDQTTETALPTIKNNTICKGAMDRYLPHKTDCNKFYQCTHGEGVLRVCQANLHWSVELNQCEWPCTAKCDPTRKCSADHYDNDIIVHPVPKTQFRCPSASGLFSDPDNCKRFYHCSHGIAHHKWCPSDLHFNARIMVCDWPDRAGCAQSTLNIDNSTIDFGQEEGTCSCECCLIPDEKDCQTFYLCLNMKLYRRKCSPGLLYNADVESCDHSEHLRKRCNNNATNDDKNNVVSPTCQKSGELLPHESDCNRFYHCDNGIPHLNRCPTGLHLSVTLQRCEQPCVAKCEETANCDKDQNDRGQTNNSSVQALFTCPSYSGLFPDINNCNKFFHCDHYIAHHKTCPSKLHFNPSLRVCDWPYRAGCIKGKITRDPTDAIGECSCECCLQADDHQCNKFTLCLHGKLYQGSCSEGLFFNPQEETCDLEEKVRHLCTKEKQAISNVCKCTNCRLPHPTNCTLYHQCSGGTAYEERCPAGQSFNRKTSECDQTEKVECPIIGKTELCSTPGQFKSPNSCNEFIICSNGRAYIEKCPSKLEYDPDLKVCTWPKGKCK